VVILATQEVVQLKMLGVGDPYPVYCGDKWYEWNEIKPLLYEDDDLPEDISNQIGNSIPSGDEFSWAKLAFDYGRLHVDMFELVKNGYAFKKSNATV